MPHFPLWKGICFCVYLKSFGFVFSLVLVGYLYLRSSLYSDTFGVRLLRGVGWGWIGLVSVPAIFMLIAHWYSWYSGRQNAVLDNPLANFLTTIVFFAFKLPTPTMGFKRAVFTSFIFLAFALGPGVAMLFVARHLRLERRKEI